MKELIKTYVNSPMDLADERKFIDGMMKLGFTKQEIAQLLHEICERIAA